MLHFSKDEAYILQKAIHSISEKSSGGFGWVEPLPTGVLPGSDRNESGLHRNVVGLHRNASGLDRNTVGLNRNACGLNRNTVGLDRNICGLYRNAC
ncbi:hypothetical protein [Sunxiuqinia rutila]|uniref:hypothetical protein n=1 Tax=Sunxiuqinia rutila TaxID=1397841 RepID=UPI003D35D248